MSGQRLRIAVAMDRAMSSFQDKIRRGVDRCARQAGFDAVYFGVGLMNPESDEDRAREAFFDFMAPEDFDGFIIVSSSLVNASGGDALKERLERLRPKPIVSIGPSVIGEDNVMVDNRCGIGQIMDHLIRAHGYRDFAYVSGPLDNQEARIRLDAFREALDAAGIPRDPRDEYVGDFTSPSGYDAVSTFLDGERAGPRAIVCANDLMATGAWRALDERGIAVPHDIAVTGYDDTQVLYSVNHQFTTIRQDFAKAGFAAAKRLLELVEGGAAGGSVSLSTDLVVRSSCGCVGLEARPAESGSEGLPEPLRAMLRDILEAAEDDSGLSRKWIRTVHESIRMGYSVHQLEGVLREALRSSGGRSSAPGPRLLLANLQSILLEEANHDEIVVSWMSAAQRMSILLYAIHRLRDEMSVDLETAGHAERYSEIAGRCGAKIFIVLEFLDNADVRKGARVLYRKDDGSVPADWSPGEGAWLPPSERSLVASMLCFEKRRFGHVVIDADLADNEAYQYVAINLSDLFRDIEALRSMRRLNSEMSREISSRLESELKLKEALSLVEQLSIEDELTRLHNRRGFMALAEQQVRYLRRQREPFFIIFIDLDGLKGINDRFGHKEGDEAIRAAATVIRGSMRDSDLVARLGGDEFTVLASQADESVLALIKKRIGENCGDFNRESGKPWKLSMSMGGFVALPECALPVAEMMDLADAELYKGKEAKKRGPPRSGA